MDIAKEIGLPALLGQLAEEAAELTQAALKLQRILMGTNPTPVTEQEARENLAEEGTDVNLVLDAIGKAGYAVFDPTIYCEKNSRWEERIMEAQHEQKHE